MIKAAASPARTGAPLFLSFACLLIACGSDSTQVEEGLSPAEVQSLVQVLDTVHTFDLDFGSANPWPCPGGGTVSIALIVGMNEPGIITYEHPLSYVDCAATSLRGDTFTLDGSLSVLVVTDLAGATMDRTASGEITWRLAGREGSCFLNLDIDLDEPPARIAGSACGIQIHQAID